jgi:hypothetical protein
MACTKLSRRVEKVVGYPPLCDMDAAQRREFQEALLDADSFEDLPGKWQAAVMEAEQNRPKLRVVSRDEHRLYVVACSCRSCLTVCERRLDIFLDRPAERC